MNGNSKSEVLNPLQIKIKIPPQSRGNADLKNCGEDPSEHEASEASWAAGRQIIGIEHLQIA
jgi:hypothetical protein